MAQKPKSSKLTGRTVTLLRTRPKAVQANDTSRQATLGLQLDKGGSSVLYAFEPALDRPAVAKIYSDKFRADPSVDPFTKLLSLVIRHHELMARMPFVMWPDELIFERAVGSEQEARTALLGFTMPPLPEGTISLFAFLKQPKYRAKFPVDAHARLAARLAAQMADLHAAGLVFCDLNPKNIRVSRNIEQVYFLDADGYQTTLKGTPVPSRGVTEGYASPAAIADQTTRPTALRTPEDDCFVLAVLIFQLLVDRAHPFATGPLYAAHPAATRNENIAARRFAFSDPGVYHPEGDTQAIYARLAMPLKAAFLRSFLTPTPLSATDWVKLLTQHAASPLASGATPDPRPSDWKAPPPVRVRPTSPAQQAPRRAPSRRLGPVIPPGKKKVATVAAILALPASLAAAIYSAAPKEPEIVAAPRPAWTTVVRKPVDAAAKRQVQAILADLPESMAAFDVVLKDRNAKGSK